MDCGGQAAGSCCTEALEKESKVIVTNIETVPGKTIVEFYGMVSGSTVRAKHVGKDILASLKNLILLR